MIERVKRKISAIMSADVVGYSKLMEADEETTVRTMESYRKTVTSLIEQHSGTVIDSPGDNILSEFGSVVDAVQCAVEIQHVIKAKNAGLPEARRMEFRIGINLGDVIEEDNRTYGDGVNIAARIEKIADAGGICISESAYQQIKSKLSFWYEDLGAQSVKNITEPVRVYRIPLGDSKGGKSRWRFLPWSLAGLVIVIIGILAISKYISELPVYRMAEGIKTAAIEKPSIAVLPFGNLSDDPGQEHFVDGTVDTLITKLSMNRMLTVIARNSTFYYKDKHLRIKQIGNELGARYIVEGSIWKANNRIRITVQLIDASTEGHIWAQTYDREIENIFAIQDEITQKIAAALNAKTSEAEITRAAAITTDNLTALDAYWRGLDFAQKLTKEGNAKAEEYLEKAIELDPNFAAAYSSLGQIQLYKSTPESFERATELAYKAIALDKSLPDSYRLLAHIYQAKGELDQALIEAQRAIDYNLNDAEGYKVIGDVLVSMGKFSESIENYEKAIQLHPIAPIYFLTPLSRAYRWNGEYEKAIATINRALSFNPDWVALYRAMSGHYMDSWFTQISNDASILDKAIQALEIESKSEDAFHPAIHNALIGVFYLLKMNHTKAIAAAEKAIELDYAQHPLVAWSVAVIFATTGRENKAMALLEEQQFTDTIEYAFACRQAGQIEKAIATLEKFLLGNLSHMRAFWAYLELVIVYAQLDRVEEAKTEAAKILKLSPNFAVDVYGKRIAYKDRSLAERDMAALRKAGLK